MGLTGGSVHSSTSDETTFDEFVRITSQNLSILAVRTNLVQYITLDD